MVQSRFDAIDMNTIAALLMNWSRKPQNCYSFFSSNISRKYPYEQIVIICPEFNIHPVNWERLAMQCPSQDGTNAISIYGMIQLLTE